MDARASLYLHLPFLVLLAILGSNFHLCDGDLRIACTLAGGAGAATLTFTNNRPTHGPARTPTVGAVGGYPQSVSSSPAGASYSFYDIPNTWFAGCGANGLRH
ncbi:hypothetical protein NL676_009659 [Syzygium grande]|nr:hypothetical protein NL676_009659 [Syzygium grande]